MPSLTEYLTKAAAAVTGGKIFEACELTLAAGKLAQEVRASVYGGKIPTLDTANAGRRGPGRPSKTEAAKTTEVAQPAATTRQRGGATVLFDLLVAAPLGMTRDQLTTAAAGNWTPGIVQAQLNRWIAKGTIRRQGELYFAAPMPAAATEQQAAAAG